MKDKKLRIAALSTFPPTRATHGGQHRIKNVVQTVRAYGHDVQAYGVLGDPSYGENRGYLNFPGTEVLSRYVDNPSLMEDVALGEVVSKEVKYFNQLSSKIDQNTEVLFVEQPWLFEFAQKYANLRRTKKPTLVYNSYNVECNLKRDIVQIYFGEKRAKECYERVLTKEISAINGSDFVTAVSEEDARWIREHTGRDAIVVKNGVDNRRPGIDDVRVSNLISKNMKFALYCASGHPPNIDGFFSVFRGGVGCFSPSQRLIVAGAAGSIIANDKRFRQVAGLSDIFVDAGVVSDRQLVGLLATAHVIVLPISNGGGTNLKTAEALWAGKHIVTTSKAMRGFETFLNHDGINVADGSIDFCNAIRTSMESPPFELSAISRLDRKSVLWTETLKPFVMLLSQVTGNRNA